MARMSLAPMISDPKMVDVAVKWAERSDAAFVGQSVYHLMTVDLRSEMKKVRSRILLVGAGKAFASNSEQLTRLQAAYEAQVAGAPNHEVVMADRALHFIMLDDPEFLFRTTDEFLERR